MAKRAKDAKAEIKIRLTEALRGKIERAARARGVSMNAEMIEGLGRYYHEIDLTGGPEIAALSRLFASTFLLGGANGARACGHPEWKPEDWVRDSFCFRAAVAAAFFALKEQEPRRHEPKGKAHVLKQWRKMDDWAAQIAGLGGKIKVTKGDNKP